MTWNMSWRLSYPDPDFEAQFAALHAASRDEAPDVSDQVTGPDWPGAPGWRSGAD